MAAASQSLPFLVPAQSSPHQAWSEQTAKWCYDVLDHLQLSREIVYLSMNLLEKALLGGSSSENHPHKERLEVTNKHEYEKMAIASLFLAVRLVSTRQDKSKSTAPRRKLQISELLTISGSSWTVQDIQQSSSKILQVLGLYHRSTSAARSWNFQLHQSLVQATPHSFCKLLFFGFHKKDQQGEAHLIPREMRLEWLELALYLIELSVCDGSFHRLLPSVIALSSLQTASKILQSKQESSSFTQALKQSQQVIEETLRNSYGIWQLPNTTFVGNRLEYIYQQSQDNRIARARASRRNSRATKRPSSRACAFTCPTMILDDDGDDQEVEEQAPFALAFKETSSSARLPCNPAAVCSKQATPTPTATQTNNHHGTNFHPIRHVQSDLDLEALGRLETMVHRSISPCPNNFDNITYVREGDNN